MFKYEIEIAAANEKYQECLKEQIFNDSDIDFWWAKVSAFGMSGNGNNLSVNAAVAIKKYYEWDDLKGYVRVRKAKGTFGVDRSDRDKFERNNIIYPHISGLYMICQTFFNPITDEKFYWVKVGEAADLNRRRKDYNTTTAMIWDVGYYTNNDLTELGCHEKLKEICLHRHADEWFSVPYEDYMKICEMGFDWFKEA